MAAARSTPATGRHWAAVTLGLLMLMVVAAGCRSFPQPPPAGFRQLAIPVENESGRPVRLVVADDGPPQARPYESHVVPPYSRVDIVFTVPPTEHWAIFVNPGERADVGPLIIAHDVARCVGRVPIVILIQSLGDAVWSHGAGPPCVTP